MGAPVHGEGEQRLAHPPRSGTQRGLMQAFDITTLRAATIQVANEPDAPTIFAAEELQRYLYRLTSVQVPIAHTTSSSLPPRVDGYWKPSAERFGRVVLPTIDLLQLGLLL